MFRKKREFPKYGIHYEGYIIDRAGDGVFTISPSICDGTLAVEGAKSVPEVKAVIDRLNRYELRSLEDIAAVLNMDGGRQK